MVLPSGMLKLKGNIQFLKGIYHECDFSYAKNILNQTDKTDLESNPLISFTNGSTKRFLLNSLPNAMTLATVKQDQTPAVRVALLKELD